MNNYISHTSNFTPWDVWISLSNFVRDLFYSFTNNFESPKNRVLFFLIFIKF